MITNSLMTSPNRTGNGERYEGAWKLGKRHGNGILTFRDGSFFSGLFKDVRAPPCLYLQNAALFYFGILFYFGTCAR